MSNRWTTDGHPLNDNAVIRALGIIVDSSVEAGEASTLGQEGFVHNPQPLLLLLS